MRTIEPVLTPELRAHVGKGHVWKAPPYPIATYRDLVEHVARLSMLNPDHLLFYRGQDADYQSKAGGTTLYPPIYRDDQLPRQEVRYRYRRLKRACRQLVDLLTERGIEGHKEVARKRFVQWSILQHYEVLASPLLDITQSLRVACSFAQLANTDDRCMVFVLALPYVTNRIAMNSEHDLVNIRLLSICPPIALRPYFQEGFLTGTTDITDDYPTKTELDFRNRLVAKFSIPGSPGFWGADFAVIPRSALFPDSDAMLDLCNELRETIDLTAESSELGEFLQLWIRLERGLLRRARQISTRNVSVREAIQVLVSAEHLPQHLAAEIDDLRRTRNYAVHGEREVPADAIRDAVAAVRRLLHLLDFGTDGLQA